MAKKELDFERIVQQAREFREQEEKRIAIEKEEEARRIAAEKQVERERIAQAQKKSLEKQQEELNAEQQGSLLRTVSFETRASQPKSGTVKIRAEWLRKLTKDAVERKRLEEEFNSMLETRRKQHPNEAATDAEAAVKAALVTSSSSNSSRNYGVDEDIKKIPDQTAPIAEEAENSERRLQKSSEEMDEKFKQTGAELETEKESYQTSPSDVNSNERSNTDEEIVDVSPRHLMDECADTTSDPLPVSSDSAAEESMTITTVQDSVISQQVQIQTERDSNIEEIQKPPKQEIRPVEHEYGAEVDPRTQAMLHEDGFAPTGKTNNMNDYDGSIKERNKKSLVLDGSIPVDRKIFRRIKGSADNNLDDDDDFSKELVHKEATFELPMEVTEDGLKLSPTVADLSMITTIPPSRLDGRVSGILEGRSSLGNQSNTASGSATLEYKSSRHSRLTLGMTRGCEAYHPLITIGGRLLRHGTSVGVIFYHNAKFLHQMMLEHSLWSLSFRHCFSNSKWTLSSQLSRRKDLSLSLANGSKLSGLIGWNLLKPKRFHARIDARPKLTQYRKAHLYCQWKASSGPSVWNFGVSLVQSLHSEIATVGLGWRLFSARGLEWVISWSRGNATIQIPILVSKSMAPSVTIGQTVYFSVISYMIQDYIAEAWGWIGNNDDDDEDNTVDTSIALRAQNLAKARQDATIQKELMARQARRKTKEEKEKDGLIIKEAVYKIENCEEWDVTVPLQFWVSSSTLTLSARPKSDLLGFYDIAASLKNSRVVSSGKDLSSSKSPRSRRRFPSWSDVWHDLLDWAPKDLLPKKSLRYSPTLTVYYEFQGISHEITIKDREELRLPYI